MKFLEQIRRLERVHQLIRLKATGTPEQLAKRLEVSRRTVFETISIMKNLGAPIYYCQSNQSYCYQYPVQFLCDVEFEDKQLNQLNGGEDIFSQVQNLYSKIDCIDIYSGKNTKNQSYYYSDQNNKLDL